MNPAGDMRETPPELDGNLALRSPTSAGSIESKQEEF